MSYNILDTLSVCSGLGVIAAHYKFQDERENHGDSHSTAVLWKRIRMATATVFAFIASSATISKLAWLCGYNLSVKGAVILGGAALSISAISVFFGMITMTSGLACIVNGVISYACSR